MKTFKLLKYVSLFFMFVAVVLVTAEVMAYFLLKIGIAPRDLDFVKVDKVAKSKLEIESNIHKKIKYEWKYNKHEDLGEVYWPLHITINNVTQLKSNATGEFRRHRIDGSVMYKYIVTTDGVGRRKTTLLNRSKHALVMGCSFVFGEGVEGDETIAEFLQLQSSQIRAYNLGYSGHTVDDIYIRARDNQLFDEIPQQDGVAIYIVMGDHVRRSFGAMRDGWRLDKAKLLETSENEYKIDGAYWDHLKGWRWLFYYYANSYFAHFFNLDYPITSEQSVESYVKKIRALKSLYLKKFKDTNKFYVVLYPDHFDDKTRNLLRKYLNIYGIDFVDYSKYLIDQFIPFPESRIQDGHPSKAAHKFIAKTLIEDLHLN